MRCCAIRGHDEYTLLLLARGLLLGLGLAGGGGSLFFRHVDDLLLSSRQLTCWQVRLCRRQRNDGNALESTT